MRKCLVFGVLFILLLGARPSFGASLIRDAELEEILSSYIKPIARVAGLRPESIKFYLIADRSVNAFTAGGRTLFLHTGLIDQCEHPGQLLGVIAHEIGHIASGHVAGGAEHYYNLSNAGIIAVALGVVAAVATQNPLPAVAAVGAGPMFAAKSFLSYRRIDEYAADIAACQYLRKLGLSSKGMQQLLCRIGQHSQMNISGHDPYLLTHPNPEDRAKKVEEDVKQSPYRDVAIPEHFTKSFKRLQLKLRANQQSETQLIRMYQGKEKPEALYSLGMAHSRLGDFPKAEELITKLLQNTEFKQDAFIHELQGEILHKSGKISEARACYERALKIKQHPLIELGLAACLLGENKGDVEKSLGILRRFIEQDKAMPEAWHLYSVAMGKKYAVSNDKHDLGEMAHAIAERFVLMGDLKKAFEQVHRAKANLRQGSASLQKVLSLEAELNRIKSRNSNLFRSF